MKMLFIDRDGVINKDPGGWTQYSYVTDPKDFHFLPGVLKAFKLLRDNRIRVVIVSNQAGVAKGYFTREQLNEVTCKMLSGIEKAGGAVEDITYCIHKDEDNCECRKPKPGMLERALKNYRISPRETFMIGDSKRDVIAGKVIGVRTIFVLSGKTTEAEMKKWEVKPDYTFPGLLEAVEWLLNKRKRKSERAFEREKTSIKARHKLAEEQPEGDL